MTATIIDTFCFVFSPPCLCSCRYDGNSAEEDWPEDEVIPTAKRILKGHAWVTSENFVRTAWLQPYDKLPSAVKKEFEDNIWGLPEECLATMDFWKEDYCASTRGKGNKGRGRIPL